MKHKTKMKATSKHSCSGKASCSVGGAGRGKHECAGRPWKLPRP